MFNLIVRVLSEQSLINNVINNDVNTSKLKQSKVKARKLIPEFVKNGTSIF